MLCKDSAIPGVKIGTAFPMANFAVWGLAIASSLFLAPSVIFFNVGFRCSRLFNTKKDILDRSYCGKVDEELSRILCDSFVWRIIKRAEFNSKQLRLSEPDSQDSQRGFHAVSIKRDFY
ncbi:unnamed protein product [Porites evermanni]|uniref:Uncharacterized protein n=1 Tax=Porites evermanni TaxID=104178 RepID=A0ABN8MM22_9CNID|nr:unnamed protein product [Porites evermanni]